MNYICRSVETECELYFHMIQGFTFILEIFISKLLLQEEHQKRLSSLDLHIPNSQRRVGEVGGRQAFRPKCGTVGAFAKLALGLQRKTFDTSIA